MSEFEIEISTGILKGTVTLPDVIGNGGNGGNGDPPPPGPASEVKHWFQDGAGLTLLAKDEEIKGDALSWVNATYRRPFFQGGFACGNWPWQAGEVGVRITEDSIEAEFAWGGLRSQLVGWASFKHGSGTDFVMGECKFDTEFILKFYFPDPSDNNRLRVATATNFPQSYAATYGGVVFEWGIVLP